MQSYTTMSILRCFNDLLTYLLIPWCRVLLEQLTDLQLVKKFPAFHGTRRFITALTSVRHLSLSWASPIQSVYPHPTSCRSVLILSTHLRLGLPSGLLPSTDINKLWNVASCSLYSENVIWIWVLEASFNIIQINFYKSGACRLQIPGRKFNKHPAEIGKWLCMG